MLPFGEYGTTLLDPNLLGYLDFCRYIMAPGAINMDPSIWIKMAPMFCDWYQLVLMGPDESQWLFWLMVGIVDPDGSIKFRA